MKEYFTDDTPEIVRQAARERGFNKATLFVHSNPPAYLFGFHTDNGKIFPVSAPIIATLAGDKVTVTDGQAGFLLYRRLLKKYG